MGLHERNRIAELQKTIFPVYAEKLKAAVRTDITIDADFQHIEDDQDLIARVEHYGIKPLTEALVRLAEDDLAKATVSAAIQHIVLLLEPDFPGNSQNNVAYTLTIQNGKLTLHFAKSGRGRGSWSFYMNDLKEALSRMDHA